MSDTAQGPGWWIASDGRWYPPEQHPNAVAPPDQLDAWAPTRSQPALQWQPSQEAGSFGVGGPYGSGPTGWTGPTGSPGSTGPQALGTYPPLTASPTAYAPSSGGRLARGLRLVGVGFSVVREEPGLLLVPVAAFALQAAIFGVAFLVTWPAIHAAQGASSSSATGGSASHSLTAGQYLIYTIAGIAVMFVSVMAQATILTRVTARFHGQRTSNTRALGAALARSPQLLLWAFIEYVILTVLRNIRGRGIVGLIVGSLLSAVWRIASFFVVPVILFEHLGTFAAVKRSTQLCRQRWGEEVVGVGAISVVGVLAIVADLVVAALLCAVFVPLGVLVGVLGFVAILLVLTVASSAFNAALYWYTLTGQSPGLYAADDLASAYRPRTRRSGASL